MCAAFGFDEVTVDRRLSFAPRKGRGGSGRLPSGGRTQLQTIPAASQLPLPSQLARGKDAEVVYGSPSGSGEAVGSVDSFAATSRRSGVRGREDKIREK